jgi:hypothetical protein
MLDPFDQTLEEATTIDPRGLLLEVVEKVPKRSVGSAWRGGSTLREGSNGILRRPPSSR